MGFDEHMVGAMSRLAEIEMAMPREYTLILGCLWLLSFTGCLLMWKYGFPKNLEDCCDYITNLPFGDERPKLECKYESIRKFSYLRFVKLNIDEWDEYQPNDDEKKLFYGCNMVRKELEKEILKLKI